MAERPRPDLHDPQLDGDASKPGPRWRGCPVEVTARLVPRYLWTTASIDVFLDGRCILRTGGQMRMWGDHSAEFQHAGETHTVELSWGVSHHQHFPCVVRIDGAKIAVGDVVVQNLGMLAVPVLLVPLLLLLAASRL